jgi:hypothetical protein
MQTTNPRDGTERCAHFVARRSRPLLYLFDVTGNTTGDAVVETVTRILVTPSVYQAVGAKELLH